MRNLQCTITDMRKKVFAEVAKLAYEGGDYYTRLEKLPYELMPGEVGTVRESIFLERAIVDQYHQVRLPRLSRHSLRGHQRLPGVLGPSLLPRLSQGGHLF